MTKLLATVVLIMSFSLVSQAETSTKDPFMMSEATYSGSGCPDGTVSMTLTDDKSSLSLIFDEFVVQAGETSQKQKETKSCNLIVPIKVPRGFQFAVLNSDQRGFYSVPKKAKAIFESSFQLTNTKNNWPVTPKVSKSVTINGEKEQDYTMTSKISATTLWSPCGMDVNLHMGKKVSVTTNQKSEDIMATIDSIDNTIGKRRAGFELIWKRCK